MAHSRTDEPSEFAEVSLAHDTLQANAYFFTENLRPVPLTDDELATLGRSPEFRDLVRLGVDYAATRPANRSSAGDAGRGRRADLRDHPPADGARASSALQLAVDGEEPSQVTGAWSLIGR